MKDYNILVIISILVILYFILRYFIYVAKNLLINLNNNIIDNIKEKIDKIEWELYRYKFLKKIIMLDHYYVIKYKEESDFYNQVLNSEEFKGYHNLTFSMFFNSEICIKFEEIIKENQKVFDTLYENDINVINTNKLLEEAYKNFNL